jgi:hypothetical protein
MYLQFGNWLKGQPYQVFIAPFDVRLPEAEEPDDLVETVVQPDLLIICPRCTYTPTDLRSASSRNWRSIWPKSLRISLKKLLFQ